jgi:hypothetical protein
MELKCLFENEHYIVCALTGSGALHSEGIEVVDKENHVTAYLTGKMRRVFMRQIKSWHTKTPQLEEVEARLDEFLVLNAHPLTLH